MKKTIAPDWKIEPTQDLKAIHGLDFYALGAVKNSWIRKKLEAWQDKIHDKEYYTWLEKKFIVPALEWAVGNHSERVITNLLAEEIRKEIDAEFLKVINSSNK